MTEQEILQELTVVFRDVFDDESITQCTHAGFTDVGVQTVPQTWRLEAPDGLFEAMLSGTVRTRALLRATTRSR